MNPEHLILGIAVLGIAVWLGRAFFRTPVSFDTRDAYQLYLASPAWAATRAQRLDIDGHRCQGCTATDSLHVHHLTYERFGNEWMTDLVTVCQQCHDLIHARQRRTHESLPAATVAVLRQRRTHASWLNRQRRFS